MVHYKVADHSKKLQLEQEEDFEWGESLDSEDLDERVSHGMCRGSSTEFFHKLSVIIKKIIKNVNK